MQFMDAASSETAARSHGAAEGTEQALTFMLDGQEYGLDILRVQEIKERERPTAIPNAPHYVKGVINLRGAIVPLVDLRDRLGLARAEYGPSTVIIVLMVRAEDSERTVGIIVDAVSDVYHFHAGQIEPAPDFGAGMSAQYVRGLASTDDKMIILLDVDRLLGVEGL